MESAATEPVPDEEDFKMIRIFTLTASDFETLAPRMFSILARNMRTLHPEEAPSEVDYALWLSYQRAHFSDTRFVVAEREGRLAGYLQYSLRLTELMIEEIEIAPEDQLWFGFLPKLLDHPRTELPAEVKTVCAYISKDNARSARIAEKLGLRPAGTSPSGKSFHYQGSIEAFARKTMKPVTNNQEPR
ncbi:MAG: hypothetical protein IIY70_01160 [Oscillospiraceae bacterium]|nr:hypothetical protein [Oscillospiraceae bacterium]